MSNHINVAHCIVVLDIALNAIVVDGLYFGHLQWMILPVSALNIVTIIIHTGRYLRSLP